VEEKEGGGGEGIISVTELIGMGFDEKKAKWALNHTNGNFDEVFLFFPRQGKGSHIVAVRCCSESESVTCVYE